MTAGMQPAVFLFPSWIIRYLRKTLESSADTVTRNRRTVEAAGCGYRDFIVALKQTVLLVVVVDIPLSRRDIENVARAITMDEQHPWIDKYQTVLLMRSCLSIQKLQTSDKLSIPYKNSAASGALQYQWWFWQCPGREQRILPQRNGAGVVAIPHPSQNMFTGKVKSLSGFCSIRSLWGLR